MSPLWRGFAGLVAVLFLAYYVVNLENKIEEERALIVSDPLEAAEQAFKGDGVVFYQAWIHRYDEDGNPIGYWFLPGEKKISEAILKAHPERKNLENSSGIMISQDHERTNRSSRIWARKYNIHLAELLIGEEDGALEKKN